MKNDPGWDITKKKYYNLIGPDYVLREFACERVKVGHEENQELLMEETHFEKGKSQIAVHAVLSWV